MSSGSKLSTPYQVPPLIPRSSMNSGPGILKSPLNPFAGPETLPSTATSGRLSPGSVTFQPQSVSGDSDDDSVARPYIAADSSPRISGGLSHRESESNDSYYPLLSPKKSVASSSRSSARSLSAPRSRITAEPKAEREIFHYPEVPRNWGEQLLRQKREQLAQLFRDLGYKLLAILMTIDENGKKIHYAVATTPKGYYTFVSLQERESYFADETWKFQEQSGASEVLPESIRTSCIEGEIDGVVHMSDLTICVTKVDADIQNITTKKFTVSKDGGGHSDSYYLSPLLSVHTIMENPKKAEETIFQAIRKIRQSNQALISDLENSALAEFAKLRDLLDNLNASQEHYHEERDCVVQRWNAKTSETDFYSMDKIISELQEYNLRQYKHLNKRLHKINGALEAFIQKVNRSAEDLQHL